MRRRQQRKAAEEDGRGRQHEIKLKLKLDKVSCRRGKKKRAIAEWKLSLLYNIIVLI